MFLTRVFVRRPTLVVVFLALVLIAGTIAFRTIVQQNFPNVDFPVVSVRLSYPGASTTEIRDAIVKPIEDAIAGAPNLDHLNTSIQSGTANITATFTLGSDSTSNLVEVQRRVQSTRANLPTDLSPPSIGTFDPNQSNVVTLAVTSSTLNPAELSALITNNIIPDMEQIDGVSNVNANGTVTRAIEVRVDPAKLNGSGFTLADVVTAINGNNVRAPGGLATSSTRETSVDVRGDVSDPTTIANLPLAAAANGSTGSAALTGPNGGSGIVGVAQGGGSGTAATSAAGAGVAQTGGLNTSGGLDAVGTLGTGGTTTTTQGATVTGTTTSGSATTSSTSGSSTPAPSASADGTTSTTSTTSTSSGSGSSSTSASGSGAASATASTSTTPTTTSSTGTTTGSTVIQGTTTNAGNTASQTAGGATNTNATASSTGGGSGTGTSATTQTTATVQGSAGGSGSGSNVTVTPIPSPAPQKLLATPTPQPIASDVPNAVQQTVNPGTQGVGGVGSSAATPVSVAQTGGGGYSGLPTGGSTTGINPWSVSTRTIRVGDVAKVDASYEVKRSYSYVGPQTAITLNVQKTTGASEITASNNVIAGLPAIVKKYPQVKFAVLNVQADYTQEQLDSVYKSLAEGILFTGIVMLFFLHSWRNAVVVLIAIPTSLLVTLFVMRLANFTVDTISLLAMTLCIGILVDDSIVVLENTERHYEDGEAPQTAAILGRTEIGPAAIVITLVDVVVFLPIAFLPGTVGKFLSEFGLVVVVATLTSLFVSFTITPALAGNWSLLSPWKPWPIIRWFTRGFEAVRGWYVQRVLRWALRFPWLVVLFALLSTVGSFALIPLGKVGFEFIPSVDRGQIFLQLTFPTGTPLSTTNAAIATLCRQLSSDPDVLTLTGTAGSYSAGFGGGITEGSAGQITIFLKADPARTTDQDAAKYGALARREYPNAKPLAIAATGTGGGNAQPIDYTIISQLDDNPDPYAREVLAAIQGAPGILNANSSAAILNPQIDVTFDRERARALDVDIATGANAVRSSFGGTQAAQFATDRGIEIVQVTYPQSAQTSFAAVLAIPVRARNGNIVHVGDIATLVNNPNTPIMTRVNRQTVVHVSANVAQGYVLSSAQKNAQAALDKLHLPAGVTVRPNVGGQQQNLGQTVSGLGAALALAGILILLLLIALYDSYVLPFIIMLAIPVASVGALGALALTNNTLNLFSLIGTVLLMGLVTKNGILLVDFANKRVREGMPRIEAITQSAQERFRPIVMTTFSMIAGMLPIALALDPGSSVRRALGVVVIGGLLSSLVLTLVLVPIGFVAFAPRTFGKKKTTDAAPPAPASPGIVRA
jgi:HAE1 family hydrophobic/amphiphilic exporter-1